MQKYTSVLVLPLFACLIQAQSFTNGQAARAVLGQQEFTFGAAQGTLTTKYLLGGPSGLAYSGGQLFVADSNVLGAAASVSSQNNNRVVVYDTTQIPPAHADVTQYPQYSPYCGLCGYNAINVLGEPDYTSQGPQPVSSQSLYSPTAVATDGHILAVADTDNNRVVIWNSIPTSMDQAANIVLGASSFTVPGQPTATQTNFRGPQGIWIQNGKLFVADTQNYRVLIWNSIPTQNNQPADLVLGQPNFSSGTQAACNPTKANYTAAANELCNPVSVSSDGTRLFVADLAFNRVLIWNSIPTSMNQPADVVLGQPDMASATPNNPVLCTNGATECAATLNFPRFVLSDGRRLYIADGGNDRVLIFNSIPTSNGASADAVLGQPDFTSDIDSSASASNSIASTVVDNTGSVDTIPSPTALAWDGVNLYVADAFNRRVLVFTPADTPLPDNSVVNWASEIIRQEGLVSLSLFSGGGGIVANDTATVTIQGTNYVYTMKAADTLDTIAQGLVTAINANSGDPNALAIFAGAGTATIYLSSKGTNLGFDAVSLSATTSNSLDVVATASGAYLSAGSAATGSAGMLVEIDGTNLSDQPSGSPAVASLSGTLPTNLAGAQVFMDGLTAPILSVSASQIITQIPYTFTNGSAAPGLTSANSTTDRNSTSVYVRTVHNDGSVTVTNATPVYIAPANPGLFNAPAFAGQTRPWPAAGALHQSGNPNAVVSVDGGVHAGDTATIIVNGRNYMYTVQASDSLASIVQAFITLINGVDPLVTASAGGAFTRVVLTAIQSGAAGAGIPISTTTSSSAQVLLTAYTNSTCCVVTPGSTISPSNPAAPGEMISLNATGLGLLANSITAPTGAPYNGPQPNSASTEVTVTMNGTSAQVVSAGLATGAIGTYQIEVIVPQTLSAGNATVTAAQNDFISNIVTLPVGAATLVTPPPPPVAPPNPFAGNIDIPNSQGGAYSGTAVFGGWVLDQKAAVNNVGIYVDGVFYGTAAYGVSRPDACAAFASSPGCPNVGWSFAFDTTQLADGGHTLQTTATSSDGLHYSASASFTTGNASSNVGTRMIIDNPSPQSTPFQGLALFSGWAINDSAAISSVAVSIDGTPMGNATYGGARPDVCTVFPNRPGCPNVGWTILVDTSKLSNGTHSVSILATAANGQHAATANGFTVANWSTANPTTIHVDIPNSQSGAFSGIAAFGGWAADPNVAIGAVEIAIDGVSYGNVQSGVARQDVCNALPNSVGCPNVGWNASVDTTLLADGAHMLEVTSTDANGHRTTVSTRFSVANLISSNPLKVYIDIPSAQSAAFSGTANLGGWAFSATASMSNVQILVDGVSYGPAVFGGARPDVCAVYPGSSDCPNVGWTFALDTTLLANGTHTLEVTGTSASGQRGTASTSFSVSNATTGPTRISIDYPSPFSNPFQGLARFAGWALNDTSAITRVALSVDGVPYANANYGVSRADVCTAFPNRPGCPNVGWTFLLDTAQLSDGNHTLDVIAYAASGAHVAASSTFSVANWAVPNPMTINIDIPSSSGGPYFGTVNFAGWVIDQNGAIASVSVAIDNVPFAGATYGVSRPDVCAAYPGLPGCPNVGWNFQLDTTLVPNGNHTLAVTATEQSGQSSTVTQTFTVAN